MIAEVDVGLCADLRFPGGTASAVAAELRALVAHGFSAALVPMQSGLFGRDRTLTPRLLRAVEETGVPIVVRGSACRARLLMIHHPALYARMPDQLPPVKAPQIAIVAHHPAVMPDGTMPYDYADVAATVRALHGVTPTILPVGPEVRRSLELAAPHLTLHEEDWPNTVEPNAFPPVPPRAEIDRLVVGRHARPDVLKWPTPETAALVYPGDDPQIEFRMLGVDDAIRARFDPWPDTWRALPFGAVDPARFLSGLDAWCYFHDPRWLEAFGLAALEAMTSGLPTILPPTFLTTFGTGPIYARPEEVRGVYARLAEDASFRADAGEAARKASARFQSDTFRQRLERLIGAEPPRRSRPLVPRRAETALVVTSNGTGIGHVARQIAIAQAAPIDRRTVFFSVSRSVKFAADAGFLAEHRTFHEHLPSELDAWNDQFRDEVGEAMRFHAPDVVVFDGNMPYRGLVDALGDRPGPAAIWVRRGLWRAPDPEASARAAAFDLVLEPGELAATADPGHARCGGAPEIGLPPIVLVPPRRQLSRSIARRMLGIDEEATAVLISLGSGRNFDMGQARKRAVDAFHAARVVEPANPLAPEREALGPHHRQVALFPAGAYLAAFDAAILAAGYNFFHEAISAQLPTLFVPNTAPQMDLQEVRARHAAQAGWSLAAAADDPYGLDRALARLKDPEARAAMRAAMARIETPMNGAEVAARHLTLAAREIRCAG